MSETGELANASLPFAGRLNLNSHPTRPWARWVAKGVDLMIVALFVTPVISAAGHLLEPVLASAGPDAYVWTIVSITVAVYGIALTLYDAVCVKTFGRTVGKALMGVRFTTHSGTKPSLGRSLTRSVLMWLLGLGLVIPFFALIPYVAGYILLKWRGHTPWDRVAGVEVETTPVEAWRWALGLALIVGGFVETHSDLLVVPLIYLPPF